MTDEDPKLPRSIYGDGLFHYPNRHVKSAPAVFIRRIDMALCQEAWTTYDQSVHHVRLTRADARRTRAALTRVSHHAQDCWYESCEAFLRAGPDFKWTGDATKALFAHPGIEEPKREQH